jgi:hypothetical protein
MEAVTLAHDFASGVWRRQGPLKPKQLEKVQEPKGSNGSLNYLRHWTLSILDHEGQRLNPQF